MLGVPIDRVGKDTICCAPEDLQKLFLADGIEFTIDTQGYDMLI
jgi:hypothetical protein